MFFHNSIVSYIKFDSPTINLSAGPFSWGSALGGEGVRSAYKTRFTQCGKNHWCTCRCMYCWCCTYITWWISWFSLIFTNHQSWLHSNSIRRYFWKCSWSQFGTGPARQAALGVGIPNTVVSTSVNKVCALGMKAGGMETMSNVPKYIAEARSPLGSLLIKC
ncbi:hypothetical protein LXL04_007205 [Taraxacum kok-saghyz]